MDLRMRTGLMLRGGFALCSCLTVAVYGQLPKFPVDYPVDGRVLPCYLNESLSSLPFCNFKLSAEERAADLVSRFTLAEKLAQLSSGGNNTVARLGVSMYQYHSEGLHGIRASCRDYTGLNSTLFPQVTGMAATGNLNLIYAMGEVMATEARALNNVANGTVFEQGAGLNYWGPTMNIGRDPRWGRFQESVSEDPFLNGAYAANLVRAMQGEGDGSPFVKIAACCKHFYAYSLESSDGHTRHDFNSEVSARDLAETYLPAFRACAAARAEQVMCSYNAVNGVPTCLDSHAQQDVLRNDFGFRGMIVSDCDAIADAWKPDDHGYASNASDATAKGIKAGCDMDCGTTYATGGEEAVKSGALPMADLDTSVARSLAMRFRLGEFDKAENVEYKDITKFGRQSLDTAASRSLAMRAAEESIVLLQNRPTQRSTTPLLPIAVPEHSERPLVIGVVGPTADPTWAPDDKDSYCPSFTISPLAGLVEAASRMQGRLRVEACPGCCVPQTSHETEPLCDAKKTAAFAARVDIVVLCLGGNLGGEAHDWSGILPARQAQLAEAVHSANHKSIAVLVHGNPMAIDGLATTYDAIVETFEGGQSAGTALASMLLGQSAIAPSGVLPWTVYPDNYTASVNMSDMSMHAGPGRTYRFFKDVPTYPFGHGLTYTNFDFRWGSLPAASQSVKSVSDGLKFDVNVTNSGSRAGAKVVAAYVQIVPSGSGASVGGPLKQLFAIQKVQLEPGQSQHVSLDSNSLPGFCSFCSVSDDGVSMVRSGKLIITIGTGGHDESAALLTHGVDVSEHVTSFV